MRHLRVFLANIGFSRRPHTAVSPPLGLLYLAAHLRNNFDVELRVVNQRVYNFSHDILVRQAVDLQADIIGLRAATAQAHHIPYLTKAFKQALPGAWIVLGGPHVSAAGVGAFKGTEVDIGVIGEGERPLEAIVQARSGEGELDDIPGILWRDEHGDVVANPGMFPPIEDLDSLPFPAYDLIDLSAYWKHQSFPAILRRRYISLFSSRGCPYNCNYCHHIFGKKFRGHSAERIVDEIQYFQRKYNIDDFEFLDDAFNLSHKRLSQFCDLVQERGLHTRLVLPNGVRTDVLTESEIEALVDAGLYFCSFALESGSPRIQKMIGKNLDIPKFIENVDAAADKGVFCNGYAMLGFTGETEDDMRQTIDAACRSSLHTCRFFTVTPFPGTTLYEEAKQRCPEQLARLDYANMDYDQVFVNLSDVPDRRFFYYQRKANRKFYNLKRFVRIIRDHPQPIATLAYAPAHILRNAKGVLVRPKTA